MHFTSTIWLDIKSQKISEHRVKLRWAKSDARTQFRQVKIGQPQRRPDKEAQDSLPEEVGGGWWPGQADRPTWSADLARGPHCLNQDTWRLLIGHLGRLQGSHPMASCYKNKGVEIRTHTPHSPLLKFILHSL